LFDTVRATIAKIPYDKSRAIALKLRAKVYRFIVGIAQRQKRKRLSHYFRGAFFVIFARGVAMFARAGRFWFGRFHKYRH
jgi:hypothetical protein